MNNYRTPKARLQFFRRCVFGVFVLFSLLASCRKDGSQPSWDVDVLAPLVKGTLTINDILPDSLLQHNPDNSLDIVYKTSLYSFSSDTLFNIRDTVLQNKYVAPIVATVGAGGTIVSQTEDINSITGGVQLTHVTVKSGYMNFSIKSSIKEVTYLTYTLPKVTDPAGNFFNKTFLIPAGAATAAGVFNGSFDLSGYKIDLTGPTGSGVNTMRISYTAIVDPLAPAPVSIAVGDSVVIFNSFVDIIADYAKGYFGNSVSNIGPDSTGFSLFNHITAGSIDLSSVDIGLNIENSIGADARFMIQNLTSVNSRTGISVPLTHAIIGSDVHLNRAVDNNGNVTPTLYQAAITPVNSNVKLFVENLPDKLSYQMDFELNPLGNVSGSNDFIYRDKLMKTEMNITIPLSLIANDLTLVDTLDFNVDESTDNVNSGTLYLYADNGFPFTAEAQLYVMDAGLNVADSLISFSNVIQAPPLDANFVCAGKQTTRLAIPLDAAKLELLRSAKKMLVKMKFNTTGKPNYMKIYDFYEVNVKLVGDFNYTVGK